MEFLKNISEKTLIITNNNLKEKILEFINSLDKLINVKLMTKSEFSKHYFYDYNYVLDGDICFNNLISIGRL